MDMDNLNDIISNLSGDDIERLRSLASSIMGDTVQQEVKPQSVTPSKSDMEMLLKAKSIIEKMNSSSSKDAMLISALKPYLSEQKRERADQSIRLLRLLDALPYIKELF